MKFSLNPEPQLLIEQICDVEHQEPELKNLDDFLLNE
jgi:hypothetical protein